MINSRHTIVQDIDVAINENPEVFAAKNKSQVNWKTVWWLYAFECTNNECNDV